MQELKSLVSRLPGQTVRSIAFLSRLPVSGLFFSKRADNDLREDAAAFAIAGLLIGVPPALLLALLSALGASALLASTFSIFSLVVLTGALHEDGLADTADGFGGGHTRETRLEIMKDPRIGSYGVIALAGGLGLRIAALSATVMHHGAVAAGFTVIAVAACSRAALVWYWSRLPNARTDGVSASIGSPTGRAAGFSALTGLAIFAIVAAASTGLANTIVAVLLGIAAVIGFRHLSRRMIGGQTGDTIGACQQLVEVALLTGLALQLSAPN